MTKSKGLLRPRIEWTAEQIGLLRARYPHERTEQLVGPLGRNIGLIYSKARRLGLSKSAEFLSSEASGRIAAGTGLATRFAPGQRSWNVGMNFIAGGRAIETQFKSGQKPANYLPIGSERLMGGYLQRKLTDTGYPPHDWVCIHIIVWTAINGAVPEKHVIAFRDGDKTNISPDNLECVSRSDWMRRNSLHRLPKEVSDIIHLRAVLTRQINKRNPAS